MRSWIIAGCKGAVTVLLLYLVHARTPLDGALHRIQFVDHRIGTIIICALFVPTITTAIRWQIVLRHLGSQVPFAALWRYVISGTFFNQVLPSGTGGDAWRIWYAHRSGASLQRAVASVVVDRLVGLIGLLLLIAMGAPYLLATVDFGPIPSVLLATAVTVAAAILGVLRVDAMVKLIRKLSCYKRLEERHMGLERIASGIAETIVSTRQLLSGARDGPIILGLSLANQVIIGTVIFVIAAAIGDALNFWTAILVFPYVLLASMIPISLGGWGIRESAMVVIFSLFGMSSEGALTVSIIFGLGTLIAALPGGVLWLVEKRFKP